MKTLDDEAGRLSDDNGPLVSICIPTFNRYDRLKRAVASALGQSYSNIEIVISDNASTDETQDYCIALANGDSRVRYERNAVNLGPTENFNRSRSLASGEYIMWLGDDDRISPDYVRACLNEFDRDPSLSLVTGEVKYLSQCLYSHDGRAIELSGSDERKRVLSYYSLVSDNGTFYGLSPRWAIEVTSPMKNRMGNDWFLLGELAWLGGFRTSHSVYIERETGGATRSLRDVARSAGLSRFEAEAPQLAISINAGWNIVRSPVFKELGLGRLLLGSRVTSVLLRRLMPEAVRKLRDRTWRNET